MFNLNLRLENLNLRGTGNMRSRPSIFSFFLLIGKLGEYIKGACKKAHQSTKYTIKELLTKHILEVIPNIKPMFTSNSQVMRNTSSYANYDKCF